MGLRQQLSRRVDVAVAWRAQVAVGERIDALAGEVADLRGRLDAVAGEASWAANELARLAPQLDALELRYERDHRGHTHTTALTGGPAELAEAGSVLEQVRVEHDRVRARLSLVSSYEERLRRLEQGQRP
jgi:hypothetical protein